MCGRTFALIGTRLTLVSGHLTIVGDLVALVGDAISFVGHRFASRDLCLAVHKTLLAAVELSFTPIVGARVTDH
ncbi:hypothetical protein GCM10010533_07760 [Mycolicibacterium pallens]